MRPLSKLKSNSSIYELLVSSVESIQLLLLEKPIQIATCCLLSVCSHTYKHLLLNHTLTGWQWLVYSLVPADVMADRLQGANRLVAVDLSCGTCWTHTESQKYYGWTYIVYFIISATTLFTIFLPLPQEI